MTCPMPAAARANRNYRRSLSPRLAALGLATALFGFAASTVAAAVAGVDPMPLGATASASPGLEVPAGEPRVLVLPAVAPGATEPAVVRAEGKVAAGKPVPFVYRPTSAGMVSIGVASPQSAARIEIFVGDSPQAVAGTSRADGAIRLSYQVAAGDVVKIMVYTAGPEIPFRVELLGGPGSM